LGAEDMLKASIELSKYDSRTLGWQWNPFGHLLLCTDSLPTSTSLGPIWKSDFNTFSHKSYL